MPEFLVTVMKWRTSGKGYKHLDSFSYSQYSNLWIVLCKRLTLSAASIFVAEGLFIYTYISCYLKKIIKIGFPEQEKNFCNDFALFRKMTV